MDGIISSSLRVLEVIIVHKPQSTDARQCLQMYSAHVYHHMKSKIIDIDKRLGKTAFMNEPDITSRDHPVRDGTNGDPKKYDSGEVTLIKDSERMR